jgi:hypothetical protein
MLNCLSRNLVARKRHRRRRNGAEATPFAVLQPFARYGRRGHVNVGGRIFT